MGNSLLDFVMALVRDPAMAARYAADPAGVLADAHLAGVTIADVDNLIPVVTDSLAAATPGFGVTGDTGNVWTSGAAAAAFDAFDIHVPLTGDHPAPHQPVVVPQSAEPVTDQPGQDHPPVEFAPVSGPDESPAHPAPDAITPEWVDDASWQHPHVDPQTDHYPGDPSGFDLY